MRETSVGVAASIAAPSGRFRRLAELRQQTLIKPPGALGRLEGLACWFAARQHRVIPRRVTPGIAVFAADHGVAQRGVSAFPASITGEMLRSLAGGVAAINVLARMIDAAFTVVDVGVALDHAPPPGVRNERIAPGTSDLSMHPAMSIEEVNRALGIGTRHAREMIVCGCDLLIAGEIGIGNTTAAACLGCAILHADPEDIVGCGTGIDEVRRAHKVSVVRQALARRADRAAPLHLLADLGGLEIAAMTGFYLEAARSGVPVVLDGFISTAAAMVACLIDERSRDWLLASHLSDERGHAACLAHLGLEPLIDCGMRLGEGTGAALVVPMIQAAIQLHSDMATFAEAGLTGTA